jgi:3-oxoacyl-[acyl-carrier-protein] synthase-3
MKEINMGMRAIAYVEPDEFISSDQIECDLACVYDKLKLPYGRIEMQTGIKSRGVFHAKLPSDISILAGKELFKNSDVSAVDIDLLIHASVCRDFLEPSTASVIHHGLALREDCLSFDLSNACLGVMSAIQVASDMIKAGTIKNALVVTGENSKPLLTQTIKSILADDSITRKTIKKYFANFTIGSSGVAICLSSNIENNYPEFKKSFSLSDTSAHTLCQGGGSTESLAMETDSEELMKRGVALAQKNWNLFKDKLTGKVDHFICHQVGIHHREFMYKSLDLDINLDHMSFDRYGNTGSAALPLTLAIAAKKNNIKKGQRVCLLGIGSGLHTQMTELIW